MKSKTLVYTFLGAEVASTVGAQFLPVPQLDTASESSTAVVLHQLSPVNPRTALYAISVLSRIGMVISAVSLARKAYGENYHHEIDGKPGAWVARHPIVSFLIPFVSEVSAFRLALDVDEE